MRWLANARMGVSAKGARTRARPRGLLLTYYYPTRARVSADRHFTEFRHPSAKTP
eukprot:COSAG05_NODE_754_length_7519_cov_4.955256_1_plen_55_part_00